jgi:hypothetical protein
VRATALCVAVLLLVGCRGGAARPSVSRTLAQPPCGTYDGRGCAPPGKRVDLARPSFSNPTRITNPLFPIGRLRSVVLLGHVEGMPFRTETTLLPGSRTVVWDGRPVRVLVYQYVAYLNRRIEEVALDRYAHADDGSVWYFGEDVFDYRNGTIANTEGTWLAGREGPPAMIMPAKPRLGDVFRTENVPGVVFEEVTVKAVGRTVAGPVGPVAGAMMGRELHSDGTGEDKLFAPGYGEFRTAGGGDLEALALAVPANALPGPLPPELRSMTTGAIGILESTRTRDWPAAASTDRRVDAAWHVLRAGRPQPRMVAARMEEALARLASAVQAHRPGRAAQAAIDVTQSALDLELRYRPAAQVDADRFVLHTQQLRVDAAAHDLAGVTGEVAVLEWIRDRLSVATQGAVDAGLRALRVAADAKNLPAAADQAARLAAHVRALSPG